jgi:TRAP-type mannitol/chloroaromatic compound transport system permease small subunit
MKILQTIDSISIWSGKIFRWAGLVLSGVVLYEVFSRYFFGKPTTWAFDSAMFFYSAIYLLGGAYVLREGAHIRVDVFYMRFSERMKAIIDVIFYVVFFFPYVSVMTWWGYKAAVLAWKTEEISNTSQWGEQIYLWKFLIPIGFFLMFLQGIAELARNIGKLRRNANGA